MSFLSDSTVRKAIFNLGKRSVKKDVEKLFESNNLKYTKVKKVHNMDFGTIDFAAEEDFIKAKEVLEAVTYKNEKRRIEFSDHRPGAKKARSQPSDADIIGRDVVRSTAPLFDLPYDQQLVKKEQVLKKALEETRSLLFKSCRREGISEPKWASSGIFASLKSIIPSPIQDGYRNKCEFTIGVDANGQPACGFVKGRLASGAMCVGTAENAPHVSVLGKRAAAQATSWLQEKDTPFPAFDNASKTGMLRQVMVRENTEGHAIVALQCAAVPAADVRESLRAAFKSHFEGEFSTGVLQFYDGVSVASEDTMESEVVWGSGIVTQGLNGLSFDISPTSFFQVNTLAAEKLYSLISDCSSASDVVLDVCCGTGTIGMVLSPQAKRVIGVEMVDSAVKDGEKSLVANGVKNVTLQCGKAEDVLPLILQGEQGNLAQVGASAVAVLDPPRPGLHASVLKAIRNAPDSLRRVIYVCCKSDTLSANLLPLLRPSTKTFTGTPFAITESHMVDLFPHTLHAELVVVLDRDTTVSSGATTESTSE